MDAQSQKHIGKEGMYNIVILSKGKVIHNLGDNFVGHINTVYEDW